MQLEYFVYAHHLSDLPVDMARKAAFLDNLPEKKMLAERIPPA
jgi:hypothetical protein